MALFPCDCGLHRYVGRQATIYPAVVNGAVSYRRKLRLCEAHFSRFADELRLSAQNAQISFQEADKLTCIHCHKPAEDSPWQFYATVYPPRLEREDFWSVIHEHCAPLVAEHWLLDVSRPE